MTNLLELVLALLKIEVSPDDRILPREFGDLCAVEIVDQARVDFSWELQSDILSEHLGSHNEEDAPGRRSGREARC